MQLDNFRKQKVRMRPLPPENGAVVVVPESFMVSQLHGEESQLMIVSVVN